MALVRPVAHRHGHRDAHPVQRRDDDLPRAPSPIASGRGVDPDTHERYSIADRVGLIAGEALVAVIIPLLVTLGLMKLPS